MTKDSLIASLIGGEYLKTPSIIKAFQAVDRASFVLPEFRSMAYEDHPLPIGYNQTISQPLTVGLMLEWLAPKAGEKILDIGCGSGWTTALLAYIVSKQGAKSAKRKAQNEGKVIGIERIPELAKMATKNISKLESVTIQRTSTIVQADGSKGYAKEAPFDKILASASAKEIPQAWKEQLKIGGRIVAPVKDAVVVIDRLSADKYQQTEHWGFAFVPLIKD